MKQNYWRPAAALFPALLSAALLMGCDETKTGAAAREITKDTSCALDGMVLQDFPGPKAQIHYEQGEPEFFCDTKEMFSQLLRPEQKRRVVAVYTQDMAKADWNNPQSYWVDARKAYYVVGSQKRGSMGPTVASFAQEQDARAFAAKEGGKALPYDQVTLDMVDLTGGVVHDTM
ncbi:MAG TPA: nitrous oxide reductase accessory protein NosL [Rhodocyclaceae bacterium]|nr:nitrous oxide reductase accessory protein NosL [Rhodocyclaceae bacterium]